jgi:hypothetical protein
VPSCLSCWSWPRPLWLTGTRRDPTVGVEHEGPVVLQHSVDLARLAPSVHNTQPWRFQVDGVALTLSRDPGRRLEALDPSGRQQVISGA